MRKLWLTLVASTLACAVMSQTNVDNPSLVSDRDTVPLFLRFKVNDHNGVAVLTWRSSLLRSDDYFIVEKSRDGVHFETLSAIGGSSRAADSSFSVTDNAVGSGILYYRVAISGKDGIPAYSNTISTTVNLPGDFRFYPNPVDKLLIIRSTHALKIQVMDANGVLWFSQDVDAGIQIINVSTLQKGSYIIQAKDKETNTVISEQIIKD
jgi:hypothetical protein